MMIVAYDRDEVVGGALGHADGDGRGGVDHLAVSEKLRRSGLGRRLLATLEDGARSLGVRHLGLGSLDGAVGFYEAMGFTGKLLLQFTGLASPADVRALFSDFELLETKWRDVPQLWVQTPRLDMGLVDRVRGREGVHAQWIMEKVIEPASTTV